MGGSLGEWMMSGVLCVTLEFFNFFLNNKQAGLELTKLETGKLVRYSKNI